MKHIKIALSFLGALTALSLSSCGEKYYKVRFLNDDGALLFEADQVVENATPAYQGNTPIKAKTDQYTYTFKGWDKTIAPATADVDYTATYESAVNKYEVRFVNYDDVLITTVNVPYDGTAAFPDTAKTPEKPANDQYSYAFKGWDEPLEHITKDVTRKALFTETVRTYKVEYKNFDGTLLDTQSVEYGENAHFAKESPKKTSDESYDYIFSGWDYPETNIVKDMTLTAQFSQARNSFSVAFVNDDNSVLDTVKVAKGGTAVYTKDTPVKAQDEQYTYSFVNWDYPLEGITEDCTRKAIYDHALREYSVVYKNWDGSELESGKVKYGQNAEYTQATPTKLEDELHTYTFQGWDKPETNVVKDMVFTAVFKDVLKQYTVTFYDGDNKLVYTAVVDAGADAVYQGLTPTKATNEKYDYTFSGWDARLNNIRADTKFTAQFTAVDHLYTTTFKNEDGSILGTCQSKYGETAVYSGTTPTKEKDVQYSYTFSGWDKTLNNITCDGERYAQFAATTNVYTVNFVNYDGSILQSSSVDYGSGVAYTGSTPTKPADTYGYYFTGWDQETSSIKGDLTVTAQFAKADYLDYVLNSAKDAYVVYASAAVSLPSHVYIPSVYNGLPVKMIGSGAFKNCGTVQSVEISEGITTILSWAFANLNLSSVSLPNSLTSIDDYAFDGDTSLKNITFSDYLLSIGRCSFRNCGFTSLILPAGLTLLGDSAFNGCSLLSEVVFKGTIAQLQTLNVLGGVVFSGTRVISITCSDGSFSLV